MGLLAMQPALLEARTFAVAGKSVDINDPKALRRLRGGTLAMVFQDPLSYLNPLMRAGRQIEESIRLHDKGAVRAMRLRELLELVHLPPTVARSYPHELSGGMRQWVRRWMSRLRSKFSRCCAIFAMNLAWRFC